MLNFGYTFIWTIVNLIILYIALRLVLFKPITRFMEKRSAKIKSDLENADKSKAEAALLRQEYENKLKNARAEAEKIINTARNKSEKDYDEIIAKARKDAENILVKSREEIELERQEMIKGVKNQVASLALSAASKVLEENMDTERNRIIVEKFLDKAGVA